MDTFKSVLTIFVSLVGIAFAIFLIWAAPNPLCSDYSTSICVDKAEKILPAMTNALNDVTTRGFIVIDLDVKHYPATGNFGITVRGITQANLLKED